MPVFPLSGAVFRIICAAEPSRRLTLGRNSFKNREILLPPGILVILPCAGVPPEKTSGFTENNAFKHRKST